MKNRRSNGGPPRGVKSKQLDIVWEEPEPFALVVQTAQDGEQIVSAANEKKEDQKESEKQQEKFHVL